MKFFLRSIMLIIGVLLIINTAQAQNSYLRCYSYEPLHIPLGQSEEIFFGLIVNMPSGAKRFYEPFVYVTYHDYINIRDQKTNVNVKYSSLGMSKTEVVDFLNTCKLTLIDTSIIASKDWVSTQGYVLPGDDVSLLFNDAGYVNEIQAANAAPIQTITGTGVDNSDPANPIIDSVELDNYALQQSLQDSFIVIRQDIEDSLDNYALQLSLSDSIEQIRSEIPDSPTASEGLIKVGNDIRTGGTLTSTAVILLDESPFYNESKTYSAGTGNLQIRQFSTSLLSGLNLSDGSNANSVFFSRIRTGGTNGSTVGIPGSVPLGGRWGISVNQSVLDASGSGGKSYSSAVHLSAYRSIINLVGVKSAGFVKPEISSFTSYVHPQFLSGDTVTSINGANVRVSKRSSVGDVYLTTGFTAALHSNSSMRGNSNIIFGSYLFNSSGTGAGFSHNTTIYDELENTGNFAFYDQTGWNNYFKGSLGLGQPNPHAAAKLDVVSTTQGIGLPEMTQTQRDAISPGSRKILIYCTDCTANDASTGVTQTWNGSVWKSHW